MLVRNSLHDFDEIADKNAFTSAKYTLCFKAAHKLQLYSCCYLYHVANVSSLCFTHGLTAGVIAGIIAVLRIKIDPIPKCTVFRLYRQTNLM